MQLGQIVFYTVEKRDIEAIEQQRRFGKQLGNAIKKGEAFPALIVKVNLHEFGPNQHGVNLRVFLDGSDLLWVTSRTFDDRGKPGTWRMNEQAKAVLPKL